MPEFSLQTMLTGLLARGFAGWTAELSALQPAAVRRFVARRRRLVAVDVDDDWVTARGAGRNSIRVPRARLTTPDDIGQEAETLRRAGLAGRDAIVRLGGNDVLRRTLTLPLAAEENLREVLAFEMDRTLPFPAAAVCFDHRLILRLPDTHRIRVDLVATPCARIEPVLALVVAAGLRVRRIGVTDEADDAEDNAVTDGSGSGVSGTRVPPFALRPGDLGPDGLDPGAVDDGADEGTTSPGERQGERVARWRAAVRRPAAMVTAAGVAVALAAVAVAIPLVQAADTAAALSREATAAAADARAALALRERLDGLLAAERRLVDRRQAAPLVIAVVDELSRRLPDDTFLTRLQVRDGEVELIGQSTAASSLIQTIENAPLFTGVAFRSPVTRDLRSGRETFHIGARIRPPPKEED